MKRIKRGGEPPCQKQANENKKPIEALPTRILRSTKRKLLEDGLVDTVSAVEKRPRVSVPLSESSDCVIVDEIVANKPEVINVLTSTPLVNPYSNIEKFDVSCIKTIENINIDNDSSDVIVISDSSNSILPCVDENKDEKCDSEIEIIPSTSGIINDQKNTGEILSTENKNFKKQTCGSFNCIFSNNKLPKLSRQMWKNRFKRKGKRYGQCDCLNNKISLVNEGPSGNQPVQPLIGRNVFVESSTTISRTGLRPVIIDGSNVAFHHSNNRFFSCKGLEICIKYFKIRGHEVIAFVPQFRMKCDKSDNPKLLGKLVKEGDVVLTPSREIDGKSVVSYDDRFIVQTAAMKGGVIVTRDNYRDLLIENPAWAETIKYRLLQFTWVKDILMFPNDPLGARGPTLEEFLKFDKQ